MSDSPISVPKASGPRSKDDGSQDSFSRLKRLLVGPEQELLTDVRKRLDDPRIRAGDVSRVIAEAIVVRSQKDDKLVGALLPTVSEIVKVSVKKDPKTFAAALFPVMGPAIRKAIAETFRNMIQSLNQTLEQTFSLRGLKWRFEALRTRKSFAEVVLAHTLLYQVEQVFLIHRESGLLLEHVSARSEALEDRDLVSGMLTAIQDFVRDSFKTGEGEGLDTLKVGELAVWIERGPEAILACVIRGNAPEELRTGFQSSLEAIHLEQAEALDAFDGDAEPFEAAAFRLEDCLQARYKTKKKRISPLLWLLFLALLALPATWAFFSIRDNLRWSDYLQKLDKQPGIIITKTERRGGKYIVYGLRDPLAADPARFIKGTGLDPRDVVGRFKPYQALDAAFVAQRRPKPKPKPKPPDPRWVGYLKRLRAEPGIVVVSAEKLKGRYYIYGFRDPLAADPSRLLETFKLGAGVVTGHWEPYHSMTDRFILMRARRTLEPPQKVLLTFKDGVLTAKGYASHKWVHRARVVAPAIAGVGRYRDRGLVDVDLKNLMAQKRAMERLAPRFEVGTARFAPGQEATIRRLVTAVRALQMLTRSMGRRLHVEIVGHADPSGTQKVNMKLSRDRAEKIRALLLSRGIVPSLLSATGVGSKYATKRGGDTERDREADRRVTFRLTIY